MTFLEDCIESIEGFCRFIGFATLENAVQAASTVVFLFIFLSMLEVLLFIFFSGAQTPMGKAWRSLILAFNLILMRQVAYRWVFQTQAINHPWPEIIFWIFCGFLIFRFIRIFNMVHVFPIIRDFNSRKKTRTLFRIMEGK